MLAGAALVDQLDLQAAGQEGGLAQALGERLEVELDLSPKISMSGTKVIVVPVVFTARPFLNLADGLAALVALRPDRAVAPDLEVEPLRERVDDRDADAVQAARDLVAAAVAELAAGVQRGQHDLGGGLACFFMPLDGDAAAVVDDGAAVVRMQGDGDPLGMAGDRLVHGVVHDLVDEVVQPAGAGRADVHAGALADGLEALEDGDVLGAVGGALASLALLRLGCGAAWLHRSCARSSSCSLLRAGRSSPLSFLSVQSGDASTFVTRLGKSLRTRGSRPHSSTHKSTSREAPEIRGEGAQKPCKSTNKMRN